MTIHNHPWPGISILKHPQPVIILLPPPTTTDNQAYIHHHHRGTAIILLPPHTTTNNQSLIYYHHTQPPMTNHNYIATTMNNNSLAITLLAMNYIFATTTHPAEFQEQSRFTCYYPLNIKKFSFSENMNSFHLPFTFTIPRKTKIEKQC